MDRRRRLRHLHVCMFDAVKRADDMYVRLILAQGANPNVRGPCGWAPLHWAANSAKRASVLNTLLNTGAQVNIICTQTGKTPLHIAAEVGNLNAVRLLLNYGANIMIKDFEGHTARDLARKATRLQRLTFQTSTWQFLLDLEALLGYNQEETESSNSLEDTSALSPSPPRRGCLSFPFTWPGLRNEAHTRDNHHRLQLTTNNAGDTAADDDSLRQEAIQPEQIEVQAQDTPAGIPIARCSSSQTKEADDGDRALTSLVTSVQCNVCRETLHEPVTLPCGHCFCAVCCHGMMRTARRKRFKCPLDGTTFSSDMMLSISVQLRTVLDVITNVLQLQAVSH
eukprot:m.100497 g.100497  ORF g.100497 m.100497 type:complete len:338 (-) comp14940_c1_seq1:39-1052(-)